MSNQYFENNDKLKSDERELQYYFRNEVLKFTSDSGVFSKGGIDFGSSLLLKTLIIKEGTNRILDVGCGYGPMGITIAKTNKNAHVDMVDVNLRAISLAIRNAAKNGVSNVTIFESNAYENINNMYDLIVTNPPIRAGKAVVHNIILGGFDHLKEGGSLWCVIQKKQGAESALKVLREKYTNVVIHSKDKLYYIIEAIK